MTTFPVDGQKTIPWNELADRVLGGDMVSREEALSILRSEDDRLLELLAAAFRVRRRFFGNEVQLYFLKNAKSGLCTEDCSYCSQSVDSAAEIRRYPLLDEEKLLQGARQAAASSARTYCIVSSGRGPNDRELDQVARIVAKIKSEFDLHLCCSLGLLTPQQARQLKVAGVDRVNHNLNTSRRFYESICSTHTYDDRLETLHAAKEAGLELCCGVIVGMGEDDGDIVDTAMELRDLDVASIPVNFLNPIDGTQLEQVHHLTARHCLKVLCLFRLVHPRTEIRIAGGREVNLRSLQAMGLYAANSMFVSDYLTTEGQSADEDFRMIADLGFRIVGAGQETQASPSVPEHQTDD